MPITKQQIINRALAEVGVKECPPNSNRVKYNTWYYGKEVSGAAYPWCMTFIQWLFKDSGLLPIKTASCSALYNKCKELGWIVTDPLPADIVLYKWDKSIKNPCQHVGFVVENVDAKHFKNVEGNTSITSDDNGGSVMLRVRPIDKSIVAFIRPPYVDAPATTTQKRKSNEEVAMEIYQGKGGWGNNPGRRQKLEAAGYDYNTIRDLVNALVAKNKRGK